jgi:hypothetical protein
VDENILWIPISKVPEKQRDELRADMAAGRIRYRYLDAASFKATSDEDQPSPRRTYLELNPGVAFWRCARINWTWSTAVAGPVVICGLEVRLDGESTAAEVAKEPHALSKKWKALVRAEFETRHAAGAFRDRRNAAKELQKWLEKAHGIGVSWYAVQNELPLRRSWVLKNKI